MRIDLVAAGIIGLAGIFTSASAAEPAAQLLTGAEFSKDTSYAYLGHVAPLPGSAFGDGFVRRFWVDWSRYRYDGDGQTHDVNAPGAAIALGYQRGAEFHWWAAYAGLTYRHSSISPDDPTSTVRGTMVRPQFQLEGERTLERKWKIGGNASYITGQKAYWARGRLSREISSGLQLGIEAIAQGDPAYHANQFGMVLLGLKPGGAFDAGLKFGVRQVHGLSSHVYFGIELGRAY